ncbi:MAG: ATP-binding protein [Kiloniellales bacterium]|nr:ATP-binding protein [Kiloniellales bacterium]
MSDTTTQSSQKSSDQRSGKSARKVKAPIIVGIGASAGGLEALQAFVRSLVPDGRFAYVVAQHLSPTHRSMLMELLARETRLNVVELTRAQRPQADTIYTTPPNKHVEIVNGALVVRTPKLKTGPQPSVDVFFASMALDCEEQCIGIIFSGTGSDGARGIQAIKAAGGVTCVQDESAKYDGMPRAAKATGCVDFVLAPATIAERLPNLSEPAERDHLDTATEFPPDVFEEIISIIRTRTKIDFSDYRSSTIWRRVTRRIRALHLDSLEGYYAYLTDRPEEADLLAAELLIRVTSFFRDAQAFDKLSKAIQDIVRSKRDGEDLRIWVPGCASGEEAFTIAILFLEAMRKADAVSRLQVFATDLDNEALAIGRRGLFPASIAEQIKPSLLRRYFSPLGPDYTVRNKVREHIVFSKHNLIEDPPFSRLDLISCRNLFIYLNTTLQRRMLERFHYALHPGGVLFLGKSESAGERAELFAVADQAARIYRAATGVVSPFRPISSNLRIDTALRPQRPRELRLHKRRAQSYEAIATTMSPPAVVIDRNDSPVHIHGPVGAYLRMPSGEACFDIFSLIHGPLRPELRALLAQSRREKIMVRSRVHTAEHEGDRWQFRMEVYQFLDKATGEELDVVGFVTLRALVDDEPSDSGPDASPADLRVEELEHEIASMREHLQTLVEELETSNEELQSLNEELQSSNEELQSTNEELETSNEELQSTNEELTTVNEEMAVKTQELHETNAFLSNILESIGHPVIVTDSKMKMLRFNSAASKLFKISDADIGNAVTSLKPNFRMPNLRGIVDRALTTGRSKTQRIRAGKHWYQLSVHPCLQDDRSLMGAVIVFDNVTKLVETNTRLREGERELAHLSERQAATLNSLPAHIALLDQDGAIIAVNEQWRKFGVQNGYAGNSFGLGSNYLEVCDSAVGDCAEEASMVARKLRDVLAGRSKEVDVRYPCHSPNQKRWFKCICRAVDKDERRFGAVVMHINETDQVLIEESMTTAREMAEEANLAKSTFLANMSHELRTPLNAIIGFSEMQMNEVFGCHSHPKYLEYAKDVHGEAQQLLEMIDEILDLSKVEAGKQELQAAEIDVKELQRSLFKVFERSAARKHLLLSARFPGSIANLWADDQLLRRMLSNLLANAVKFTPDGGMIEFCAEMRGNGGMALTVQDNGIGIDSEQLSRVIEPFSQVRSTLTSNNSGVGLGLALVNSLVRLHGGRLDIESEPKVGTKVSLLFPPERVVYSKLQASA